MKTIQHARERVLACLPLASAFPSSSASAQSSVPLYGTIDDAFAYSGNQHGKSPVASGSGVTIANTVAVVGDSRNSTPSSGPSQFVGMVGIRHAF